MQKHVFGEHHERGLEIHPDNWRAVQFFCFCTTQWNTDNGVRTGLNYPAVRAVFNMFRIPERQHHQLMSDIQLMELGVLMHDREHRAEAPHGT